MQGKQGRPSGIHTPIKYLTEDDKKYRDNNKWHCPVCEREYSITSKGPHLETARHKLHKKLAKQAAGKAAATTN